MPMRAFWLSSLMWVIWDNFMFFIEIKMNYTCVTDMCVSAWQRDIIESKKYQHTVISGQHALNTVSSLYFCPPQFLRHFLKTQGIQILTDH